MKKMFVCSMIALMFIVTACTKTEETVTNVPVTVDSTAVVTDSIAVVDSSLVVK